MQSRGGRSSGGATQASVAARLAGTGDDNKKAFGEARSRLSRIPCAGTEGEAVLIRNLLKYAATGPNDALADAFDDRQFRWTIDAGLGPLLYHAARDDTHGLPEAWRDVLLSAELTSRVAHGNLIDTAGEIADVCEQARVPVTLLKGISISDQYYPAPHLRPMGDVDVLVAADAYERVNSALVRRGYEPNTEYEMAANAPHGVPLYHPGRRVWVEVHTALFGGTPPKVFGAPSVAARSIASTFHGRTVHRLADELQLVYIAYSWICDMSRYTINIQPSCVPPLLDAVYLLKARHGALDWDGLLDVLDDDLASASLYVLLALLARCGIDTGAARMVSRLASRQSLVGPVQLAVILAVLERYLLGGRTWNLVLPLPMPGRYNLRHQLRKRLARKP